MNPESNHKPEDDVLVALEFRNPSIPELRVVNRTTNRIDGFPDKLEPRRDCEKSNEVGLRGWQKHAYWENF